MLLIWACSSPRFDIYSNIMNYVDEIMLSSKLGHCDCYIQLG